VLRPSITCWIVCYGIFSGIQYRFGAHFDERISIFTSVEAAEVTNNQTTRFQDGNLYLASGRAMRASDRLAEAVRHFQQGIAILGEDYVGAGVIDDTSMKYILAETQVRDRNFQQAASLLEHVLETRLNLFAKKYRISN